MSHGKINKWWLGFMLTGLVFVVGAAAATGVVIGGRLVNNPDSQVGQQELFNQLKLHAGTAARGKSISMATGLVDENVEGLYVLDHISGNLQCWILNSRTGGIAGIYRANVLKDLASDKTGEADYVMVTGNFFYSGGNLANNTPANSLVYVADVNTGNVVGYLLAFNRQGIARGVVQSGALQLVCQGQARDVAVRDQ